MLMAILAAVLFAGSAVCGQSLSRRLGGITANLFRVTLASTLLGLISWWWYPGQIYRPTCQWLMFSGLLGFGLGDVALFLAYPLLGARTAVLVNLCVATIVGALCDWVFLRTRLSPAEMAAATLILGGVVLAMHKEDEPFVWNAGLLLSLFSGSCGGVSLMLSRHAQQIALTEGLVISGAAQAFQRIFGGMFVGWIAFAVLRTSQPEKPWIPEQARTRELPVLILISATVGPVIGVSLMQIALQQVGSSAKIAAISSTVPLMLLPISRYIDHQAPSRQAVMGSFLSVGGVIAMAYCRS